MVPLHSLLNSHASPPTARGGGRPPGILYTQPATPPTADAVLQQVVHANVDGLRGLKIDHYGGNDLVYQCIAAQDTGRREDDKLRMVEYLIDQGNSPGTQTAQGTTELMVAAERQYPKIVRKLLPFARRLGTVFAEDDMRLDAVEHAIRGSMQDVAPGVLEWDPSTTLLVFPAPDQLRTSRRVRRCTFHALHQVLHLLLGGDARRHPRWDRYRACATAAGNPAALRWLDGRPMRPMRPMRPAVRRLGEAVWALLDGRPAVETYRTAYDQYQAAVRDAYVARA